MRGLLLKAALGALTVAVAVAVGITLPGRPVVGLAVAMLALVMGLSAINHAVVPLLSLPFLFVVARATGLGIDVSVSDVVLALATVPALLLTRRITSAMRSLVWLTVLYLAATLFTVVANPYPANAVEWVHAAVLVGGALFVGWTIGREGLAALALTVMMVVACLISLLTIVAGVEQVLRGDLEPVYLDWPFGMHKNFIGCVLGIMAVVAYVSPPWMGWGRWPSLVVLGWLVAGIGFSQSRQAIIALAVVVVVLVLRQRAGLRRSRLALLVVIPVIALVVMYVIGQLRSGNEFNSVLQRLSWFSDSIEVWQTSPWVGVGLRWWYTDRFPVRFQPPNAELEVLTSAGLIGLAAFLILMIGALRLLWKLPPVYGTLAFLVLLSRFVQGQFDLFWTAATVSIPFVIVGLCLGQQGRDEAEAEAAESAESLRTRLTQPPPTPAPVGTAPGGALPSPPGAAGVRS